MSVLLALSARAQPADSTEPLPPSRHALWVGMMVGQGHFASGPAGLDNDASLALAMYATYRFRHHLFTARALGIAEPFIFFSNDAVFDYGLLYGRYLTRGDLFLSASAGLALVEASRGGGVFGSTSLDSVLGVPLQAEVTWRPTDLIGFSVLVFGNANLSYPFGGVTVGIQVGNIR